MTWGPYTWMNAREKLGEFSNKLLDVGFRKENFVDPTILKDNSFSLCPNAFFTQAIRKTKFTLETVLRIISYQCTSILLFSTCAKY